MTATASAARKTKAPKLTEPSEPPVVTLLLSEIKPAKENPRKSFEAEETKALAKSIKTHGVLQPIIVRKAPKDDGYQIIAGERRWRAMIW